MLKKPGNFPCFFVITMSTGLVQLSVTTKSVHVALAVQLVPSAEKTKSELLGQFLITGFSTSAEDVTVALAFAEQPVGISLTITK